MREAPDRWAEHRRKVDELEELRVQLQALKTTARETGQGVLERDAVAFLVSSKTHQLGEDFAALLRERDEIEAVARDVLFHQVVQHPLPWHVEEDWTQEVTSAGGTIIAKCRTDEEAARVIAAAQAVAAGSNIGPL